jgi:hypothetical protein
MWSWDWLRRLVDLVGVLVIIVLIASASIQWWRGSKQGGRLVPGLIGILVGGTILLLNNWGALPTRVYTPARWLGIVVLLLGAIALWRK